VHAELLEDEKAAMRRLERIPDERLAEAPALRGDHD
jgi:hypothetical protein